MQSVIVSRAHAFLEWVQNYILGKFFVYSWISSSSAGWFCAKHRWLSMVPFSPQIFGWSLALAMLLIVVLAGIVEAIAAFFMGVLRGILSRVAMRHVSFRYFALTLPIIVLLLWLLVG